MNTKSQFTCKIFAHRGANKLAFENTQEAFDKALEFSIDGIETDVQLSRDDIPVLWHDRSLKKRGLPNKRIDDFDFDRLRNLTAPHDNMTQEIMSLQAFINQYRARCILNIEVKNRAWETLQRQQRKMQLTLQMIGSSTIDDIFVSSFNLTSLEYAYQLTDQIPFFYILDDHHTLIDIENFLQTHAFLTGFCVPIELVDEAIVQQLRECNKMIVTYTCNTSAEIIKAFNHKVDVMITDDPQQALQLRSS